MTWMIDVRNIEKNRAKVGPKLALFGKFVHFPNQRFQVQVKVPTLIEVCSSCINAAFFNIGLYVRPQAMLKLINLVFVPLDWLYPMRQPIVGKLAAVFERPEIPIRQVDIAISTRPAPRPAHGE